MGKVIVRLTVLFEEPFWVGVFERTEDNRLSACKVTFGAEPRDYEVQEFILKHYSELRYSPAVSAAVTEVKYNPKRMQREVNRQIHSTGIGTKSQQALSMQREQNKQERRVRSREEKLAETERMFEMKQQKKARKAPRTLSHHSRLRRCPLRAALFLIAKTAKEGVGSGFR